MQRSTTRMIALIAVLALLVSATGGIVQAGLSAAEPAAPRAQGAASTLTFAVIGDYGMDDANEAAVAAMVNGWNTDLIVATGDDYYSPAGGTGTGKYDESTGAYYCSFLKDISTTGTRCPTPGGSSTVNRFFPSLGNHDYSDAGTTNNLPSTYTSYFALPGAGFANSSNNERYYDFVQGPVHFFIVNSNTQEPDGTSSASVQAQWLQAQLAASTSPWNVVIFHHPPYSSGATHGSSTYMRWPFGQWGADVVLNGHDHTYERIRPGDGVAYFVNGIGGAARYNFTTPVAGSEFRYNANWGAQRVTASDTSMTLDFLSIDNGGTVRDSITLSTGPTPTPTADPAISVSFQDGIAPDPGYAGTTDTTLSQASPDTSYGSAVTLLVDGDDPPGSGNDLATLLRWDVASIPAGSTVASASITFNVVNVSPSSYALFEMKQPWVEGEATWNVYGTGVPWAAPGATGPADRGAASLGGLSAASLGLVTVDLNAAGVALVQSWVDTPAANRGLIIADTALTDGADLESSEAASAANRPKLTIRYFPSGVTPTPINTPTDTPVPTSTPVPTATPVPTSTPAPIGMHVGDLDGSRTVSKTKWTAIVAITLHDANHQAVSGVTVTGNWSAGATGSSSCTTASNGTCQVSKANIKTTVPSVSFTVTNATKSGYAYNSAANHDVDGGSNGTTITVTK